MERLMQHTPQQTDTENHNHIYVQNRKNKTFIQRPVPMNAIKSSNKTLNPYKNKCLK